MTLKASLKIARLADQIETKVTEQFPNNTLEIMRRTKANKFQAILTRMPDGSCKVFSPNYFALPAAEFDPTEAISVIAAFEDESPECIAMSVYRLIKKLQ